MSNQGWIKLHRKVSESRFCVGDSERLGFWINLLVMANHTENTFLLGEQEVTVKEGQFATGRKRLSEITGVSEMKVERWLTYLETVQQIKQQTFSKYRIITICKWSSYQSYEQENAQQVNNKRTTSEQQVNTNKNDKNDKNEDKRIISKDITKPIGFDSRKVGMDVFASKGNAAVSSIISRLELHLGGKLDGSVRNNRNFASHLIKKYTHEQIEAIFKALPLSKFWAGKITSTQSLYNHASQIINSLQDQGGKFADLSYVN